MVQNDLKVAIGLAFRRLLRLVEFRSIILKLGDPDSGARATTETPSQKRPAVQWDMGDLL
jgi:hypothetical protein